MTGRGPIRFCTKKRPKRIQKKLWRTNRRIRPNDRIASSTLPPPRWPHTRHIIRGVHSSSDQKASRSWRRRNRDPHDRPFAHVLNNSTGMFLMWSLDSSTSLCIMTDSRDSFHTRVFCTSLKFSIVQVSIFTRPKGSTNISSIGNRFLASYFRRALHKFIEKKKFRTKLNVRRLKASEDWNKN